MKWIFFVLLAGCSAAPLHAQAPPSVTTESSAFPAFPGNHRLVRPAMRPPASVMPSTQGRLSTAQRTAVMNNRPPLTELPDFSATDRDGNAVTAKNISRAEHWLLIYRRQNCLPCDRLMNVLADSESASLKGGHPYVIVVAGKDSGAAERVRANFATLSEATWLADKNDQVYLALKPLGAPMIYAMDGSRIAWEIPGNLGSPAKVEQMAASWISSAEAAPRSASSVPASSPTP